MSNNVNITGANEPRSIASVTDGALHVSQEPAVARFVTSIYEAVVTNGSFIFVLVRCGADPVILRAAFTSDEHMKVGLIEDVTVNTTGSSRALSDTDRVLDRSTTATVFTGGDTPDGTLLFERLVPGWADVEVGAGVKLKADTDYLITIENVSGGSSSKMSLNVTIDDAAAS